MEQQIRCEGQRQHQHHLRIPGGLVVSYMFGGLTALTSRGTQYKVPVDRLTAQGWNVITISAPLARPTATAVICHSTTSKPSSTAPHPTAVAHLHRDNLRRKRPTAIAYAARRRNRVSRLVLRFLCLRDRTPPGDAGVLVTQALRPLLKEHRFSWEFFTLTSRSDDWVRGHQSRQEATACVRDNTGSLPRRVGSPGRNRCQ